MYPLREKMANTLGIEFPVFHYCANSYIMGLFTPEI